MIKNIIQIQQKNFNDNEIELLVFCNDSCNYNCYYCYNAKPRTNKYINLRALFNFIQTQLYNFQIYVELIGGEPTLHPDLLWFCKELNKNNIKYNIYTNFSANIQLYNILLDNNAQLSITWHSAFKENFSKKIELLVNTKNIDVTIMHEVDIFDETIALFKQLYNKYSFRITGSLLDYNYKTLAIDHCIQNKKYTQNQLNTYYENVRKFNTFNIYEVTYSDKSVTYINENTARDTLMFNQFKNWLCNAGKNLLYINYDGNIYPCQAFLNKKPVGNICMKNKIQLKKCICPAETCDCHWEILKKQMFKNI